MRMVRLPSGEEHRDAGDESSEGASFSGTETHGGSLAEAGKGAV